MDPNTYTAQAYGVPSINSKEELLQFLKNEIGFCGCAVSTEESLVLLRDVLRCARAFQQSFSRPEGHASRVAAYREMQERLGFERAPVLATWFLYLLDHHRLVEHASNVTECWITPKGEYILAAIEQYAVESIPKRPEEGPV